MLILEYSQGCCAVKIWPLDLWPWKSIGFQPPLWTMYVPSLVKIHWRMLILVFTRMLRGKNLTWWHWPLTLKINRVPDTHKDYVCTTFGQNPLKDVDSRVFTRMLRGKTGGVNRFLSSCRNKKKSIWVSNYWTVTTKSNGPVILVRFIRHFKLTGVHNTNTTTYHIFTSRYQRKRLISCNESNIVIW